MNEAQIKILGALDATMQTVCEVNEDLCRQEEHGLQPGEQQITQAQLAAAYGGAAAMLILAKQTTDVDKMADHAAMLLNQVAENLGLPAEN